jgi:CHASE3 domain sensor protein
MDRLLSGYPRTVTTQTKLPEEELRLRNAAAQEALSELIREAQGLIRQARVILRALETQMEELMPDQH